MTSKKTRLVLEGTQDIELTLAEWRRKIDQLAEVYGDDAVLYASAGTTTSTQFVIEKRNE